MASQYRANKGGGIGLGRGAQAGQRGRGQGSWATVTKAGRGGRARDGGGGGVKGSKIAEVAKGEQHFMVVYLTKLEPNAFLKLTPEEISSMCLDKLKIPKDLITGVSQSLSDLSQVKIRGKFDLRKFEVEEIEVRPGEIMGSCMARRETASWVYFYGADIATDPRDILGQLEDFGTIKSEMLEMLSSGRSGRMPNVWTGDRRVAMVVKRQIPQHIFVRHPETEGEQMVKVVYAAQKYKCGWCGKAKACRAGKNGKRCREMGGIRSDREEVWYRHKRAAVMKIELEDSDVEDEDGEEEEEIEEEVQVLEEDGEEEVCGGNGGGEDEEGEAQDQAKKEAETRTGLRKPEIGCQPEPIEKEDQVEIVEKEDQDSEMDSLNSWTPEDENNDKAEPPIQEDVVPGQSPKLKETKQEKFEREREDANRKRAADSDMVELTQGFLKETPEEEIVEWVKELVGEEAMPVVVKNPNQDKKRSHVVKNLTLSQRYSLYAGQRRYRGQKVKASAYMEEQAMEDFPDDHTMLGGQSDNSPPSRLHRQSTTKEEERSRKREASKDSEQLEEQLASSDTEEDERVEEEEEDWMGEDGNKEIHSTEAEIGKNQSAQTQKCEGSVTDPFKPSGKMQRSPISKKKLKCNSPN